MSMEIDSKSPLRFGIKTGNLFTILTVWLKKKKLKLALKLDMLYVTITKKTILAIYRLKMLKLIAASLNRFTV